MRAAARVGYVFGIDPVEVLAESNVIHRQIRDAALLVWGEDQAEMWGSKNA